MSEIIRDLKRRRVDEIRGSWRYEGHISTLPSWAHRQRKTIQFHENNLPDIDEDTKSRVVRELLFTLRCQSCERAQTDECNFSVCVRGLLSGKDMGGVAG